MRLQLERKRAMSDYGHPITFGLSLIPSVEALEEYLRTGPRRTVMNDKPISSGHRNLEEMHA